MKHVFHYKINFITLLLCFAQIWYWFFIFLYFALIYMVCPSRDFFWRDTHNKRENALRILKEQKKKRNALNSRKFETIAVNFCSCWLAYILSKSIVPLSKIFAIIWYTWWWPFWIYIFISPFWVLLLFCCFLFFNVRGFLLKFSKDNLRNSEDVIKTLQEF